MTEDADVEELGQRLTDAIMEGFEEGIGEVELKPKKSKAYPLG